MEHTFTNTSKLIDVFHSKGIDTDELLNEFNLYKKRDQQGDKIRLYIIVTLGLLISLITLPAIICNFYNDAHTSIIEKIVLCLFGIAIFMPANFVISWAVGILLYCAYEGVLSLFKIGYFHQEDKCIQIIRSYKSVLDQLQDEHRLNQVLFASLSAQVILFDKNNEDILNGTKITVPDAKIQAFYIPEENNSLIGKGLFLLSYLNEVPDYIKLKKINERLERLLAQ